jgi:Spx/MgsR family transcriptional regulator
LLFWPPLLLVSSRVTPVVCGTTVVYGIRNCDTVTKARRWLDDQGIAYRFHDFRSDGLELARVERWLVELGWEQLINRRGTTWRQLDAKTRERISATTAAELLLQYPTLIKRPVLEQGERIHLGFSPDAYQHIFRSA